jgi:hypothetical protein
LAICILYFDARKSPIACYGIGWHSARQRRASGFLAAQNGQGTCGMRSISCALATYPDQRAKPTWPGDAL